MGINFVQVAQRDIGEKREWRIFDIRATIIDRMGLIYVLANDSALGVIW